MKRSEAIMASNLASEMLRDYAKAVVKMRYYGSERDFLFVDYILNRMSGGDLPDPIFKGMQEKREKIAEILDRAVTEDDMKMGCDFPTPEDPDTPLCSCGEPTCLGTCGNPPIGY